MYYLLILLVIGLPFSPFILYKLDIWHAQGIYAQGMILLILCCMFFQKRIRQSVINKGLGAILIWVGLLTLFFCYKAQAIGKYDIQHFFPFFNFLCLIILYIAVNDYLYLTQIINIMNLARAVIIIQLFVCVLQYFGLSQFFQLINPDNQYHNNLVTGFIGNGTHLSGFLASTIPLFLWVKNRENCLVLILMFLVLLVSSTTVGEVAISGFIVSFFMVLWMIKGDKKKVFGFLGICLVAGCLIILTSPKNLFSLNGRFELWREYGKLFMLQPVTGHGLGTVNMIYKTSVLPGFRHLHMEYFHYLFEIGIIGVILIINMALEFFKMKDYSAVNVVLKGCVLGFLISSCFNYPSHLWLPSTWAMFFYASYMALKNKEMIYV